MNKAELVKAIANKVPVSAREVEAVVEAGLALVEEELRKGGEIKISGFGNFVVKERKARVGTNPANGEKIEIPAAKTIVFKPSKGLKGDINE